MTIEKAIQQVLRAERGLFAPSLAASIDNEARTLATLEQAETKAEGLYYAVVDWMRPWSHDSSSEVVDAIVDWMVSAPGSDRA